MQSLGSQIRTRRRTLKLTQQELADLAEVSSHFVLEVEKGKESIRLDKLTKILKVLGLHLELKLKSR
ncbi:MAG: type II toxin-antitoxin system Y4mF family antitoxin [Acidimicrobiales bacterium]|jgi:y4mF family transcriptional regulator